MTVDGVSVKSVGPSTPVKLIGVRTLPTTGQELITVVSEDKARDIAERRLRVEDMRRAKLTPTASPTDPLATNTLNTTADVDSSKNLATVNVMLKADGPGTLSALEKVITAVAECSDEVKVTIIASAVGDVNMSDITRMSSVMGADTCILGFNIGVSDRYTCVLIYLSFVYIYNTFILNCTSTVHAKLYTYPYAYTYIYSSARSTAKELGIKVIRNTVRE